MVAKLLLQVDLEGHSRFMAALESKPDAFETRKAVALALQAELKRHKFSLLSWKGDGGVYTAATKKGPSAVDFAVDAALGAAKAFNRWRSQEEDRRVLRLRISLHYASNVYTFGEPGYWYSDDLNLFIKHEREIGLSGTIAATDKVCENLTAQTLKRFGNYKRDLILALEGRDPLIRYVRYLPLKDEVKLNSVRGYSFFSWVQEVDDSRFRADDPDIGPRAELRGSLGDAAFLFAAPQPDSPLSVDLRHEQSGSDFSVGPDFAAQWKKLQREEVRRCRIQNREDGRKVSAVKLIRPLSDIPHATLYWRMDRWSRVRTFHQLLVDTPAYRGRLAKKSLDLLNKGTNIPGIACCHCIVRLRHEGCGRVLACQRQTVGPQDMYLPGHWSFSFEEQLKPGESVADCIRRGLREEILGKSPAEVSTMRLLGAILEKRFLNLAFIVLVDIPMTLDEIASEWRVAVDKDEHRQLAVAPLDRAFFGRLTGQDELTADVRSRMTFQDQDTASDTTKWTIHPTAAARFAMALWAEEAECGEKHSAIGTMKC